MIQNRRKFINSVGRIFMLGTFTGGTVWLASRNKIDLSCSTEGGVCKSCSLYADCNLDQAKIERQNERGEKG